MSISQAPSGVSRTRSSLSEYEKRLLCRLPLSQPLNREFQMRRLADLLHAVDSLSWDSTRFLGIRTQLQCQTNAYAPHASGEELIQVFLPRPCMGPILQDQLNHFYSLGHIWYMYAEFSRLSPVEGYYGQVFCRLLKASLTVVAGCGECTQNVIIWFA